MFAEVRVNMKTFLYEMHKKLNLYILFFCLIMILLPVSAAKAEEREIRVGFANSSKMISSDTVGQDSEYKTGYGYYVVYLIVLREVHKCIFHKIPWVRRDIIYM